MCGLHSTGTGMSEAELKRNPVLTDYTVKDLNQDPTLPYDDNSFDVITNVVSVDYLNKPLVRANMMQVFVHSLQGLLTDSRSLQACTEAFSWPHAVLHLVDQSTIKAFLTGSNFCHACTEATSCL